MAPFPAVGTLLPPLTWEECQGARVPGLSPCVCVRAYARTRAGCPPKLAFWHSWQVRSFFRWHSAWHSALMWHSSQVRALRQAEELVRIRPVRRLPSRQRDQPGSGRSMAKRRRPAGAALLQLPEQTHTPDPAKRPPRRSEDDGPGHRPDDVALPRGIVVMYS